MIYDDMTERWRRSEEPPDATLLRTPTVGPARHRLRGADSSHPPMLEDEPRLHVDGERVEDWSAGGDLDTSVPDPTGPEITDPAHPDYCEPWRPPGGGR